MKNNILLIMASEGFLYEGSLYEGYRVIHPFKKCGLIFRLLREFVFRFVPCLSSLFYNTMEIGCRQLNHIIVWDPLITQGYLNYIHKSAPAAKIHFIYWNMVGKASHLKPHKIPSYVTKWTYDEYDARKYNLNLYTTYPYYKLYIKESQKKAYDVLFVGKDKGRARLLTELENNLREKGLTTKFIITKTDRLSRNKKIYSKEIDYMTLCDLIAQSRAVVNVVMENQEGLTLRDLEYVYQRVKLITTNKSIKKNRIYHSNNVFVLGEDDIDGIKDFLDLPYQSLPEDVLKHHEFDSFINEIICSD